MSVAKARTAANEVLARLRRIDAEPEVATAAEDVAEANRRVSKLDARVKALFSQIAEAEEKAAELYLTSGYQPTGDEGEALTPLRIARDRAREELKIAERAAANARRALQDARSTAAARVQPEFGKAYRAVLAEVLAITDEAAAAHARLQELELTAREVMPRGSVPGSHVFTRLLPGNQWQESAWETWRAPVAKYLGRES